MAPKTPVIKAKTPARRSKPFVNKVEDLSPTNPLPFEGGRSFNYQTSSEYLPFLNDNDNYGALLLQSRLLSATHDACVRTKKDYCAGNGFQTLDELDIDNKAFAEWLKSLNLNDDNIVEVNKQIFESFFTWGNVPIELVRFKVGSEKRFFIYPHNFLEWRLGKPDPSTGRCYEAIQSKLFMKDQFSFTQKDYDHARKLPIYNPRNTDKQNWKKEGATERTLIWYKNTTAGFPNYGLPSAIAGLIYQKLEYKGARFNLDELDNNMIVSAILTLRGNISDPELDKIGKRVVKNHTGDGKRGRVMVVGSEAGIESSDLHNLSTTKDGSFEKSDDKWMQKIILANQWDSILAGIISQSTMGKGMGFLTKIIEVKRNTVVIPAQQDLMRNVWSKVLKLADEWLGLGIEPDNIQIKNAIDISGLTDVDITPVVTVDEVRQAKGLHKADSKIGKKYLGELGADQKRGVYVKDGKKKTQKPDVQQK